jgi:RimJ/RimL family protein N-acetyltransferase
MIERLRDGTLVYVRPIRPTDRDLLADGLAHLSDASIHARFLSPKPHLSANELTYFTEVDGHDHVALVVLRADDPGHLLGVGRWIRLPDDPTTAEAAIVIADDYQGQGLGRRLGQLLAVAAGEHGITSFTATMLADNIASHRLFAAMTDRLETVHRGAIDELHVPLAA